ncbi:hypothetical protein NUU61_000488 [Penicillium alfredii]|uniref:Uncharacterized protein n=1 Tax=Penicillium alfredii TaxID=1506179 RepID=A0A9W9G9P8_9EURO|nr:uncharacterized protein NUU61_000488 [Penicillium alfredii]KAJ5114729.1 hypothetical protein NUU61_000488 [Penicillium alfredii]
MKDDGNFAHRNIRHICAAQTRVFLQRAGSSEHDPPSPPFSVRVSRFFESAYLFVGLYFVSLFSVGRSSIPTAPPRTRSLTSTNLALSLVLVPVGAGAQDLLVAAVEVEEEAVRVRVRADVLGESMMFGAQSVAAANEAMDKTPKLTDVAGEYWEQSLEIKAWL